MFMFIFFFILSYLIVVVVVVFVVVFVVVKKLGIQNADFHDGDDVLLACSVASQMYLSLFAAAAVDDSDDLASGT